MNYLKIIEVMLVHCNIVSNNYQDSRFSYTFAPDQPFGQLLDISPKKCILLKTFDSEFVCNKVWFTDQNSKPLETEEKININLVIN